MWHLGIRIMLHPQGYSLRGTWWSFRLLQSWLNMITTWDLHFTLKCYLNYQTYSKLTIPHFSIFIQSCLPSFLQHAIPSPLTRTSKGRAREDGGVFWKAIASTEGDSAKNISVRLISTCQRRKHNVFLLLLVNKKNVFC